MTASEALLLPGVLDAAQAVATVRSILAEQRADGAIPWFTGGHLDPWDHTEAAMALDTAGEHAAAERAYRWLADRQNPDGSWYAGYFGDGAEGVSNPAVETNFCAYPAVGVWHHHLSTGDDTFLDQMWPMVRRALDFTVGLQLSGGQIAWRLDEHGTAVQEALLTGSSSILHALRCGLAIAEYREEPQPDWELAAGRLQHAVAEHPERFLDKDRYSMDWYYPVLGTALRGPAAQQRIERDWERFVVPGLGVRCVSDRPWVTGGESAELALALWAVGQSDRAVEILQWIRHLRHEDGSYWTGYVFEDDAIWPEERTTWTAGALLLAVAALGGDPATVAVFGAEQLPSGLAVVGCC
ncbi:prenyltransferase/squalene oxidase repeat-containing protein [Kitasatospora sp. MAP12-44]|uniref:prenyltransferase/squalene oxidase repeat-containing protein n=1 Tax=Kitasatospora sp. MAP12-44 TaxID=3035099 RepID=UPI0024737AB5|nr:prenyltransferase/squalene oxidase repeat-containing protein [Kitasatospora sp. MAP12-44]